jgi:hypothetical protein
MVFIPQTPSLGYPKIADTLQANSALSAAGRVPGPNLGTIIRAIDPTYGSGEFIYAAGVASTVVGSMVVINPDDWTTTLLVTGASLIGPVAVAMSINLLGFYGWYQIEGKALALTGATVSDNGLVYATATPGAFSNAVTATARVKDALGASAGGSGTLQEVELYRPFMDNGSAA